MTFDGCWFRESRLVNSSRAISSASDNRELPPHCNSHSSPLFITCTFLWRRHIFCFPLQAFVCLRLPSGPTGRSCGVIAPIKEGRSVGHAYMFKTKAKPQQHTTLATRQIESREKGKAKEAKTQFLPGRETRKICVCCFGKNTAEARRTCRVAHLTFHRGHEGGLCATSCPGAGRWRRPP